MKNLNAKLKAKVKDAFKHNPDAEKLYVTSDGSCFLKDAKQHAVYHAHKNGLKVFEVLKSDLEQQTTGKGKKETSGGAREKETGEKTNKGKTPENTGEKTTGEGKDETPKGTGKENTGKGKDETKKADQ